MERSIENEQQWELGLITKWSNEAERPTIFAAIVDAYKQRLYWHIRRIVISHDDTDDVLQETFIKAWRFLENFKQESGLYTWLYRIATNTALTFIAKRKKESSRNKDFDEDIFEKVQGSSSFDANKLEWKLQLAIAALPEKQRVVFNLRYFDEMPYQQMSEVLETSEGALKASYHHAAKKIQEFILNNQ